MRVMNVAVSHGFNMVTFLFILPMVVFSCGSDPQSGPTADSSEYEDLNDDSATSDAFEDLGLAEIKESGDLRLAELLVCSEGPVLPADSCSPNCDGKECGTDGCFGLCGTCAPSAQCMEDVCLARNAECAPDTEETGCVGGLISSVPLRIGIHAIYPSDPGQHVAKLVRAESKFSPDWGYLVATQWLEEGNPDSTEYRDQISNELRTVRGNEDSPGEELLDWKNAGGFGLDLELVGVNSVPVLTTFLDPSEPYDECSPGSSLVWFVPEEGEGQAEFHGFGSQGSSYQEYLWTDSFNPTRWFFVGRQPGVGAELSLGLELRWLEAPLTTLPLHISLSHGLVPTDESRDWADACFQDTYSDFAERDVTHPFSIWAYSDRLDLEEIGSGEVLLLYQGEQGPVVAETDSPMGVARRMNLAASGQESLASVNLHRLGPQKFSADWIQDQKLNVRCFEDTNGCPSHPIIRIPIDLPDETIRKCMPGPAVTTLPTNDSAIFVATPHLDESGKLTISGMIIDCDGEILAGPVRLDDSDSHHALAATATMNPEGKIGLFWTEYTSEADVESLCDYQFATGNLHFSEFWTDLSPAQRNCNNGICDPAETTQTCPADCNK